LASGGNALKFYSSVRLDIRRKEVLPNNEGVLTKVKVVKNKVFPPFRIVEFEIMFGTGINKLGCLVDAAEAVGLIERKGAWYSRGDKKIGQGRKQAMDYFAKDSIALTEIENEVERLIQLKSVVKYELAAGSSDNSDLIGEAEDENIEYDEQ
jgi:recombination protein RecA